MDLNELLEKANDLGFEVTYEKKCVFFISKVPEREIQQFIPMKNENCKDFLEGMENFLSKIHPDKNKLLELSHYARMVNLKDYLNDYYENEVQKNIDLNNEDIMDAYPVESIKF